MLARGEQLTQYLRCRRGSSLPQRIHARVVRMKSSRYCCWPQTWSGPRHISARKCALAFHGRRGFQRREHCNCLINQTEWQSASNPYFEKRKVKLAHPLYSDRWCFTLSDALHQVFSLVSGQATQKCMTENDRRAERGPMALHCDTLIQRQRGSSAKARSGNGRMRFMQRLCHHPSRHPSIIASMLLHGCAASRSIFFCSVRLSLGQTRSRVRPSSMSRCSCGSA